MPVLLQFIDAWTVEIELNDGKKLTLISPPRQRPLGQLMWPCFVIMTTREGPALRGRCEWAPILLFYHLINEETHRFKASA